MIASVPPSSSKISIHAPTRGATRTIHTPLVLTRISIHAPTRGATQYYEYVVSPSEFQSTLPQGERQFCHTLHLLYGIFQSTLPQGERHITYSKGSNCTDFNPRSHKGSDGSFLAPPMNQVNFNPRSHKGSDSNFTQNSISVLFHFYQSFPHIIFPHTARFRLLIIFCTFFLVRIAQGFPVCFHFAPKQYLAFYNVCSTDLL